MAKRIFTQTFGVVAAIIEKDGRFLLVREAEGYDIGMWGHPGGWIDVSENPIEAVKREVEEETALIFTPKNILGLYSLVRRDLEVKVDGIPHALKIIFTGKISEDSNKKLHSDIDETKWFTPEQIYEMNDNLLRDADVKQMIKDYLKGQRFSLDLIEHTDSRG